ncbi:MAG: hypothetical protein JO022_16225 [Acidobacteriaceae bacterium]|nr:hypothetical protein [Acidobacteriaceae bacterium]
MGVVPPAVGHLGDRLKRNTGKSAVELCEEAAHLLRRAPVSAIVTYYVGSLPFVLAFLFFWTDMSESSIARDRAAAESLAMAVLYVWMTTCQAQFARQLLAFLSLETAPRHSLRNWLSLMASQAAVQPTKFVVLPFAALALLPFAAALAFYHNASVVGSSSVARSQAILWPRQNWQFLGITSMLGTVVFLNVAMGLYAVPFLAKMFLGIDTVFTRTAYSVLNTTFLAVAIGVSYLILNPFVRAFYVLRCFYGQSLSTAQDLRAELKICAIALALLLSVTCGVVQAEPSPSPQQLNESIDRVLAKPEYSWRLPRVQHEDTTNKNWLVRSTETFLNYTEGTLKRLGHWIDRLADKLGDLLGKQNGPRLVESNRPPPARSLRLLVVGLVAMVAGVVIYLGWQTLAARRNRAADLHASAPAAVIDLTQPEVQADQQTLEQWLSMASDCIERGELRLAVRALYLAGLSTLAAASLISLRSSKSDRDYARELKRRSRNDPEMLNAFFSTLNSFERVWYGMYEVDFATVESVQQHVDRMRANAR